MKKKSLRAKLGTLLAASTAIIIGAFAFATPAAAEESHEMQSSAFMSQYFGTGIGDTQIFYAYAKAGETITVDAGSLDGTETPGDSYTINARKALASVSDPSGALMQEKTGLSLFDAGQASDVGPLVVTATTTGIHTIKIGPISSRYALGSRPWKIDVAGASGNVSGRVFVTDYSLAQPTRYFDQTITFWTVNEFGYQYKIDMPKYNGWNSWISFNAFGNVDRATCLPTYKSDLRTLADQKADAAACGGQYLMFFAPPAADLPETATIASNTALANGATSHWVLPQLAKPTVAALTFTRNGPGSLAGDVVYDLDNHNGLYTIEIDTDGDGTYNGPLDRQVQRSTATNQSTYTFDGLDKNGTAIPDGTPVGFRISISQASEMHLVTVDVETMEGGLVFQRLNGDAIADDRIYWNDSMFASYTPCLGRPQSTQPKPTSLDTSANGVPVANASERGWISEDSVCNDRGDTPPGSWGNNKTLDTWTYGKVIVNREVRYGGVGAFTLTKQPTNGTSFTEGDTVTWSFTVKNTGTSSLGSVTIDDPLLGLVDFECATGLAINQEVTCDAPAGYVTTATDGKAGSVTNKATASAVAGQGGSAPADQTAEATVTVKAKVIPTTTPPTTAPPTSTPPTSTPPTSTPPTTGLPSTGPSTTPATTPTGSALPDTGSTPPVSGLIAAFVLLGAGAAVLIARRRSAKQ